MVERLRRARRPWRNVAGAAFVFVAEVLVVATVVVAALVVSAVMQAIF